MNGPISGQPINVGLTVQLSHWRTTGSNGEAEERVSSCIACGRELPVYMALIRVK